MITPELKDEVLKALCNIGFEYETMYRVSKSDFFSETALTVSDNDFAGIMSQFNRMGLIEGYNNCRSVIPVVLRVEATDFLSRGGFTAQEKLLKDNIIKLEKEINLLARELSPKYLEKANFIVSLGRTIISALGLMK
jgi:hypothetical protein